MSRRAFLKLLGGGAAASVSGVSVKQAAALTGVSASVGGPIGTGWDAASVEGGIFPRMHSADRVLEALWRRQQVESTPLEHMPAHITSMKSWSPTFKYSVFLREREIIAEFERRIHEEEDFKNKVASLLGIRTG